MARVLLYYHLFWGEQQAVVALVTAACNFSRQEYFGAPVAVALAIRLSGG